MSDQPHTDPPPIPGHVLDLVEQAQVDTRAALDQLIIEVEAAKNVPLSNSVMLPREEFIERMRSIRSTVDRMLGEAVAGLPEELRAARWMVREREAYIARTNESAREMLVKAKARQRGAGFRELHRCRGRRGSEHAGAQFREIGGANPSRS